MFLKNKKSPAEKVNKRKTKISNNTPETKINLQPNFSKVDWSSRRPPGYVFNKEFNKEAATFVGPIIFRIQVELEETKRKCKGNEKENKRNRKEKGIKENERGIKGNIKEIKREIKENEKENERGRML